MTDTEFRWSTLAVDCAALLGALAIGGALLALFLTAVVAPLSAWLLAAVAQTGCAVAWHRTVLAFDAFGERTVRRQVAA